jgi:hypothetical protein
MKKKTMTALLALGLATPAAAQKMPLKAERDAAAKTGGKGPFCPPAGQSSVAMKSQDLMNELKAIPAAQAKSMTVTDGLRVILGKRYPCL